MDRSLIKKKAVALSGGCCILCGYNRCLRALHFHHINPFEKEFSIANSKNWEKVKLEIEKCVLVCANCHTEIHEGYVDLEVLVNLKEN